MRPQCDAADTPKQMRVFSQKPAPSQVVAEQSLSVVGAPTDLAVHSACTLVSIRNWNSAPLCVCLPAPVFFVAALHRGLDAVTPLAVANCGGITSNANQSNAWPATPAAHSWDRTGEPQATFHALMRLKIPGKSEAQKTLAPRYMRLVPSVTVKDEKQRTFRVQERQT